VLDGVQPRRVPTFLGAETGTLNKRIPPISFDLSRGGHDNRSSPEKEAVRSATVWSNQQKPADWQNSYNKDCCPKQETLPVKQTELLLVRKEHPAKVVT
jgi:hypothetical protein